MQQIDQKNSSQLPLTNFKSELLENSTFWCKNMNCESDMSRCCEEICSTMRMGKIFEICAQTGLENAQIMVNMPQLQAFSQGVER
jgi:hypothetical protein